jgi:hypothetical protein
LPADSTLTNGVGTFSATLKTAGVQTISAKDTLATSITGTSGGTAVNPAAATHFAVSAPAAAAAQTAFQVTVTALDQFNNTATGYAGTVHFTSSDGSATLPANATLTSGVRTFAVTLRTIGSRTVTATDTFSVSITGTSGAITVGPAVTHFAVSAPASATAGSPISFTVTALDASNQVAPGYSGTIHFTSTDGAAAVPGDGTISGGTGTLSATLHTVGNRTITATDSAAASITGTSGTIAVGPGPVARFAISAPASISAGKQFAFTVTALDSSGNTATGYAGTAHFTSSDPHAALPAAHALAGGSGSFTAALATGGNQSITATDGPATGSSAAIAVSGSVAAPRIAKLAVGTVCGRARRGGLRTTFKVDQPGTVTLTIARRVGGALSTCPRNRKLPKGRYKSVKTFSFSVGSGTKKLALAATSKHRPLAPGVYELVIRAKNAFNEQSRVARVPFWVLKAH